MIEIMAIISTESTVRKINQQKVFNKINTTSGYYILYQYIGRVSGFGLCCE